MRPALKHRAEAYMIIPVGLGGLGDLALIEGQTRRCGTLRGPFPLPIGRDSRAARADGCLRTLPLLSQEPEGLCRRHA